LGGGGGAERSWEEEEEEWNWRRRRGVELEEGKECLEEDKGWS